MFASLFCQKISSSSHSFKFTSEQFYAIIFFINKSCIDQNLSSSGLNHLSNEEAKQGGLAVGTGGCDEPRTVYHGNYLGKRLNKCSGFRSYCDAMQLYGVLSCMFKIVFHWRSTQGKRKLWLRVSLVSREPS
jgi:hypothetical protein